MAKTKVPTQFSEDVSWMAAQAVAVIAAFFVALVVYRNRHKIQRKITQLIATLRSRRTTRKVERLLEKCCTDDLVHIAFSIVAWPEKGFSDTELFLARPPHYAWQPRVFAGEQSGSPDDFRKELILSLTPRTRDELLIAIHKLVEKRSQATLEWLHAFLARRTREIGTGTAGHCVPPQGEEDQEGLTLDRQREALEAATTIDGVLAIRGKAKTMELWCRLMGLSLAVRNLYAEMRIRSERKAGTLLNDWDTPGERSQEDSLNANQTLADTRLRRLADIGISPSLSLFFQRLAAVPTETLDQYIRGIKASGEEVSSGGLAESAMNIDQSLSLPSADRISTPRLISARQGQATSLRTGDFRQALSDLDDDSVSLILTDPPSPDAHLPLWADLGRFAQRVLKPGRLLVVYTSPAHLPKVLRVLEPYLAYVWTGALVSRAAADSVFPLKVRCGHKCVVLFSKGAYQAVGWIDDTIWTDQANKPSDTWEGSLGANAVLIESTTYPDELVCNPFLRRGDVAAAAQKLGRRFIGCDVDEHSVAQTARLTRLAQEKDAKTSA